LVLKRVGTFAHLRHTTTAICALPDVKNAIKAKTTQEFETSMPAASAKLPKRPRLVVEDVFPCQAININAIAAARDDLVEIRSPFAHARRAEEQRLVRFFGCALFGGGAAAIVRCAIGGSRAR
jgi:hypothetical protein